MFRSDSFLVVYHNNDQNALKLLLNIPCCAKMKSKLICEVDWMAQFRSS